MASAAQTIQWGPAFRTVTAAWPAGVPKPVKQCDGSMRVPFWDPEKRAWRTMDYEMGLITQIISRRACGDRECQALHEEDFNTPEKRRSLAKIQARFARDAQRGREARLGRGRK